MPMARTYGMSEQTRFGANRVIYNRARQASPRLPTLGGSVRRNRSWQSRPGTADASGRHLNTATLLPTKTGWFSRRPERYRRETTWRFLGGSPRVTTTGIGLI